MSEVKFTKGEWRVNGYSVSCKASGYIAKALEVFMDKSERKANAHLIASAPDMHAMLDMIQDYIRVGYDVDETLAIQIDALLAKARGEV